MVQFCIFVLPNGVQLNLLGSAFDRFFFYTLMEHTNVFFRIFKIIDTDSVKNSTGNLLNSANFDLVCLETKRTVNLFL